METNSYREKYFLKNEIFFENKKFEYYSSPILNKYEFTHGFCTRSISEDFLPLLSAYLNKNFSNCVLKQIHSNRIVFVSDSEEGIKIEADGLFGDKHKQNLCIYTADCMPILFADKRRRFIAAIHCGRKGLEKRIIRNLIKIFDQKGSSRDDLIIAIGPSISMKHYIVDKKTYKNFYNNCHNEKLSTSDDKLKNKSVLNAVKASKKDLVQLNLRKYAHMQLLNEDIPNKNIEISNLCTYELRNDFFSWRRTKTSSRQWNFICP